MVTRVRQGKGGLNDNTSLRELLRNCSLSRSFLPHCPRHGPGWLLLTVQLRQADQPFSRYQAAQSRKRPLQRRPSTPDFILRFQSPCRLSGSFLEGGLGPAPLTVATRTPLTAPVSNGLFLACTLGTRQELRDVRAIGDVVRSFALLAAVSRYSNMPEKNVPPADVDDLADYLKQEEFFKPSKLAYSCPRKFCRCRE